MRLPVYLLGIACLLISGPARAQVSATATRLSIDGQPPRFYPTFGRVFDAEFYAPLRDEVASLGLRFQFASATAQASLRGQPAATWPVVTSPQSLPKSGRPSMVLFVGNAYYLPVRAVAALLGKTVAWDYNANLLRFGEPGNQAVASAKGEPTGAVGSNQSRASERAPAPAKDPAQEQAARVNREVVAAILHGLPLPGGPFIQAAARCGGQLLRNPAPPPIRAIVRRRDTQLAFRGGRVQRNPEDLLRRPGLSRLQGKVICVDAGHGGHSGGAQGLRGLQEKDATLAMAMELALALQEEGATVIMPRVDDTYVSLDERIDFANTQRADLFVSIHCNAMPVHNTVNGTETYYDTPQSAELARCIHPQVARVVGERDGGIRRRGFAVIRRTVMPSVLVEVAYIDQLEDEAKLRDPEFRRRVGQAIRDGVVRFFNAE
jgi:N-acetylmuramoyl-L-alanine amidase